MRTENLAITFVDIAGYTPRTSAQTREENLLMLRRFDGIVRPLVRAYSGKVVKTIGDAYLLTFRSPTDALLCSMAVHDRLAESNAEIDPSDRITVRAAVNVGEVRIQAGDIFGEAVNIAARIEGKAAAGEIYFSESVFLSMTRTEVPCEEVGYTELKGVAEKIRLYRVPRADEAGGYALLKRDTASGTASTGTSSPLAPVNLPFGGVGLNRVRNKLSVVVPTEVLSPALDHARGISRSVLHHTGEALLTAYSWWQTEVRRSRAVQVGTVIVLVALIWFAAWALKPKPATPWQKLHRSLGF
jgi:adenylate cyclase